MPIDEPSAEVGVRAGVPFVRFATDGRRWNLIAYFIDRALDPASGGLLGYVGEHRRGQNARSDGRDPLCWGLADFCAPPPEKNIGRISERFGHFLQ